LAFLGIKNSIHEINYWLKHYSELLAAQALINAKTTKLALYNKIFPIRKT
jgi:hypothetical protein